MLIQVSPEWHANDSLPPALAAGGTIFGVPYDAELFTAAVPSAVPATAASVTAASVSALLRSPLTQASITSMTQFIDTYAGLAGLNELLHTPVLQKGSSTQDSLPGKLLRDFPAAIHLRSVSIAEFMHRLPSISAAGLVAPSADRLVRPELAAVYVEQLAPGIEELSAQLLGRAPAAAGPSAGPQLHLQHYAQVTFGRLDLAWQAAEQQHAGSTTVAASPGAVAASLLLSPPAGSA